MDIDTLIKEAQEALGDAQVNRRQYYNLQKKEAGVKFGQSALAETRTEIIRQRNCWEFCTEVEGICGQNLIIQKDSKIQLVNIDQG